MQFGFPVWIRVPGAERPGNRLDPRWLTGLWLGKDSHTDENIAATSDGICRGRSVRRVPYMSGDDKNKLWSGLKWSAQKTPFEKLPILRVPDQGSANQRNTCI